MLNRINEYTDKQDRSPYAVWLASLRDVRARARVIMRVDRMELGLFGDSEPVGEGLSELKIDYGPGYRVYYGKESQDAYLLLCGGNKSTQSRDIKRAKTYWQEYKEEKIMARNVRATHSEHLRNPEVAAEYLNLALQEDDPGIVLMALRNIAEAQEGGIAGLAARSRLGRESMYKMLSERGNPKLSSFTRIIHSLGLCLKVQTHV